MPHGGGHGGGHGLGPGGGHGLGPGGRSTTGGLIVIGPGVIRIEFRKQQVLWRDKRSTISSMQ